MGVLLWYINQLITGGGHPVPYNGVSSHFRSLSCGERLDNSGCGQQNSKAGPISILPVRRLGRVQFLLQDILESHIFCYETILYIYGYGSIPINTIFRGMNIHKSQLFWGSLGTRVLTHPHIYIYIYHIQIILCVSTFAQS